MKKVKSTPNKIPGEEFFQQVKMDVLMDHQKCIKQV